MHFGLPVGIDVIEALRQQRRAGRQHGAEARQRVRGARRQPCFVAGVDVLRGGPENADGLGIDQVGEPGGLGMGFSGHQNANYCPDNASRQQAR